MTDDSGRPILNLLPEAEVAGTKTQYEEADLAKAGLLALREAGGMVPGIDYALDAAELENISRTGKDFYGDETTPESYAAMVGAGMLLPGVLKRAGRGVGKAAKKFFKIGKKGNESRVKFGGPLPDNPQPPKPKPKEKVGPEEIFEPIDYSTTLPPYHTFGNVDRAATPGAEFTRRFYADPQVKEHFRDLLISDVSPIFGGRDMTRLFPTQKANMYKHFGGLEGAQQRYRDKALRYNVKDEGEYLLRNKYKGAKNPHDDEFQRILDERYGGDLQLAQQNAADQEFRRLNYARIDWNRENHFKFEEAMKDLLKANPDLDPEPYYSDYIIARGDDEGVLDLENLFIRGSRAPNPAIDTDIDPGFAGVYYPGRDHYTLSPKYAGNKHIAVHESKHFVDSKFLHTATPLDDLLPGNIRSTKNPPNTARKIVDGLSQSVKPELVDHVRDLAHANSKKDYTKYLANVDELTARANEMQYSLSDVLMNNPSNSRAIGKLDKRDRVKILLGDFSMLSEKNKNELLTDMFENLSEKKRSNVMNFFNDVLDGDGLFAYDEAKGRSVLRLSEKKEAAINNLFKYALMGGLAAGSYGAMDTPERQPSNSMYAGGVITMRKKKKGMSAIRK